MTQNTSCTPVFRVETVRTRCFLLSSIDLIDNDEEMDDLMCQRVLNKVIKDRKKQDKEDLMKVIKRAFVKRHGDRLNGLNFDQGNDEYERERRKMQRIKETLAKLDEQEQAALNDLEGQQTGKPEQIDEEEARENEEQQEIIKLQFMRRKALEKHKQMTKVAVELNEGGLVDDKVSRLLKRYKGTA